MNNFTAENWYDVGITYDDPNKTTDRFIFSDNSVLIIDINILVKYK